KGVTIALWLHLGTLLAVVVYFWRDIVSLLKSTPGFFANIFRTKNEPSFAKATEDRNENLIRFIIISTIVTGFIGVFVLKSVFESDLLGLRATFVIGFFLIITGVLQKYARRKPALKSIKNLNTFDAVLLGFFQGLAALPGLSRSGLTISTLLFRGYDDKDALKISFLMSIPAVFGVVVFLLFKGGESLFNPYVLVALFFAFLFALVLLRGILRPVDAEDDGYVFVP
ncbi:MAG: undecaprenyl-diphosphate phosphatase, partial [Chloroflexi bacterium]|nr:undecaprenyl-diphosphate phosphatase [Chloroflexota bacterium]